MSGVNVWVTPCPAEPAGLVAACRDAVDSARAGAWQMTEADRTAATSLLATLARYLDLSGVEPPAAARQAAEAHGIDVLVDPAEIHATVAAVFTAVLAGPVSQPLRRVLEHASRWEPQQYRIGGWRETLTALGEDHLEP